jgi:hypothetical protein
MLERGEEAVADTEGRPCNREVKVAAAFMSSSLSTKPSELKVLCAVMIRLDGEVSRFLPLTSLRAFPLEELLGGARADLAGLRGGVVGFAFGGGGTGGSSGLWIVLARLEGGGCRSEEKRLWVADAVTGGGGSIVPFRTSPLPDAFATIALFPCVAGLP